MKKKVLLMAALVAAVVVVALLFPTREVLAQLVRWARRSGSDGQVIFGAVYLGVVVLMIPSSALTVLAGFLYGPLRGSVIVIPPSIVGAVIAWVLARVLARRWVERRLRRYPKAAAIDGAVAARPLALMSLLRLSPVVPSNVLNYALATTAVRFWHYLAAAIIGIVPGTIVYTYAGSAIPNLRRLGDAQRTLGAQALYWGGLLATVAASILITRVARRALARHHQPQPPTPPQGIVDCPASSAPQHIT